jgi:PAS domain S-box-containing protein
MFLGSFIGTTAPFITMFPAVLVATVIGGLWPGLVAVGLSVAATWYFFFDPGYAFAPLSAADVASIALFILGALLMVIAATSMRHALDHLATAQEKLLAALDASGTGTWRWDIQRDLIEWDPAMANVFGLDAAQAPRKVADFLGLVHFDDRERAGQVIDRAIRNGTTAEYEFRAHLPCGEERWVYDRSRVVYDAEGRPLYMIGACVDVTERKRAEERQTLLLNELNHRVKNSLATVQSLAVQTLRSSPSPDAFQTDFMARLMALSATHNILTQKLWESASVGEILAAELQPYGGIDQQRIKANGDVVNLKPQQALSLGMAFHELATNAAKYGALSSAQGSITISWSVTQTEAGERHLAVQWREQGGPAVRQPSRQGFGTRLIDRSIVHELGGSVEMNYAPTGLECSFQVPLSAA